MAVAVVNTAWAGNSGSGTTSLTIPSTTNGNILALIRGVAATVSSTSPTVPSGWTRLGFWTATGARNWGVVLDAKQTTGGETSISYSSVASSNYFELSGLASTVVLGTNTHYESLNDTTPLLPGPIGAEAGIEAIVLAIAWSAPATPDPGPMTLSGYTLGPDTGYAGVGSRYRLTSWYVATSGGTTHGGVDWSGVTDGSQDTIGINLVLTQAPFGGRVSQTPLEVVVSPTSVNARVTQTPLEIVVSPTDVAAVTTELARLTLIEPDDAVAYTTQIARLVLINTNESEPTSHAWSQVVMVN